MKGGKIKTNPHMLRELLKQMSREGCAKCGQKIEYWGSRLCYIEQLPHPHILKYKILCDGCGHDG